MTQPSVQPTTAVLAVTVPPSFWIWLVVLIVAVLVGGVAALMLRSRLLGPSTGTDAAGGLSGELHAMLERGDITREEYESLRRAVVGRAAARGEARAHVPAGPAARPAGPPEQEPRA